MVVVFGNLTNAFGSLQPGAPGIVTATSMDDFNDKIVSSSVDFVYIGVGVFVSTFFGSWFWTLSGERISRRLRGYEHLLAVITVDCICRLCFGRMLLSLIALEQGR